MASSDGVNVSTVESAPMMRAADPVVVTEAKSNGRKWTFVGGALVTGAIAAVCIVALAALMIPQVAAAVGLGAGAFMILQVSLAVVGTVAFLATALLLGWGAKPAPSAKAEEKPVAAPAADAPAASTEAAKPAADAPAAPVVVSRAPSPTDDMPGRADAAVDELKRMKAEAGL